MKQAHRLQLNFLIHVCGDPRAFFLSPDSLWDQECTSVLPLGEEVIFKLALSSFPLFYIDDL